MEKIIQFHPEGKLQTGNRHCNPAGHFSNTNNIISDIEDNKSDSENNKEVLSPIYKKKANESLEKEKQKFKELKKINIPNNFYETDQSDSSPESIYLWKIINFFISEKTGEKQNGSVFFKQNQENKELINSKTTESPPEEKKEPVLQKKESSTKLHIPVKNEETISDAEADKNVSVVYKEKEQLINNHPYRHLIFSPNVTESTFKRFIVLTYRGLNYAKKSLKQPSEKFIRAKQVILKEPKGNFIRKLTK